MPFPTVKSDPWKKGKPRPYRRRFMLWPDDFWKKLCRTHPVWSVLRTDKLGVMGRQDERQGLTPGAIDMIVEMNSLLYGTEE